MAEGDPPVACELPFGFHRRCGVLGRGKEVGKRRSLPGRGVVPPTARRQPHDLGVGICVLQRLTNLMAGSRRVQLQRRRSELRLRVDCPTTTRAACARDRAGARSERAARRGDCPRARPRPRPLRPRGGAGARRGRPGPRRRHVECKPAFARYDFRASSGRRTALRESGLRWGYVLPDVARRGSSRPGSAQGDPEGQGYTRERSRNVIGQTCIANT